MTATTARTAEPVLGLELLPVAGVSGAVGMVLMKAIEWWRGKKRDSAETDAIVRQTYGKIILDLKGEIDRMQAQMVLRDAQCEADIATLRDQVHALEKSKHAMAVIIRTLLRKKPVPANYQEMIDALAEADFPSAP